MLKQRVITSLVLTFGFGLCIFLMPVLYFSFVMAGVVSIAGWEWANLAGYRHVLARLVYAASILVIIAVLLGYATTQLDISQGIVHFKQEFLITVFSMAVFLWLVHLFWVVKYPEKIQQWSAKWLALFVGLLFLIAFWIAITELRNLGLIPIIVVIFIVGFVDIGAYFFGKTFGKTKLAPHVSPGKSWAGFYGGIGSAMFLGVINLFLVDSLSFLKVVWILALFLMTALAAVLGDLVESMYKRHRGIKDSSQILPGHGGLLDRMDSHLAAEPVFIAGLLLIQSTQDFNPFQWVN